MSRTELPARRLLSVREAAERLGVSVTTMRRLQQRREIPHFKISGNVRFDPADLDAYVAASRVEAVSAWDL